MFGCCAGGEAPAFLDAVEDISDAEMQGTQGTQTAEQAPGRIRETTQRPPDEGFAQFPEEARFAESGNSHLVDDVEIFLGIQQFCILVCFAVPDPVEPVVAGRPELPQCFMVGSAYKVEGDVLHCFGMFCGKLGESFFEFTFFDDCMHIGMFRDIAYEIPTHPRF